MVATSAGESLFERLEPLLPRVQKPIQYVGGEVGATIKGWYGGIDGEPGMTPETQMVRWALLYPDAYTVGQPNQGVQILYEVLKRATRHPRRADVRGLA